MTVTLGNLLWQNLLLKLEEQLSLSVSVVYHLYSTHPSRAGRRQHMVHVLHQYIACNRQAVSGRLQKALPNPPGQNFNLAGHSWVQLPPNCKQGRFCATVCTKPKWANSIWPKWSQTADSLNLLLVSEIHSQILPYFQSIQLWEDKYKA